MADRDEKIFPAVPQKRQRAREQGQVARSRDLTSAISFVAGVLLITGATAVLGRLALGAFANSLAATASDDIGGAMRRSFGWPFAMTVAITLLLCATAVAGAATQGGIALSLERLAPELSG